MGLKKSKGLGSNPLDCGIFTKTDSLPDDLSLRSDSDEAPSRSRRELGLIDSNINTQESTFDNPESSINTQESTLKAQDSSSNWEKSHPKSQESSFKSPDRVQTQPLPGDTSPHSGIKTVDSRIETVDSGVKTVDSRTNNQHQSMGISKDSRIKTVDSASNNQESRFLNREQKDLRGTSVRLPSALIDWVDELVRQGSRSKHKSRIPKEVWFQAALELFQAMPVDWEQISNEDDLRSLLQNLESLINNQES